jgi:hypothetical protein
MYTNNCVDFSERRPPKLDKFICGPEEYYGFDYQSG